MAYFQVLSSKLNLLRMSFLVCFISLFTSFSVAANPPNIAVAASMKFAMDDIAQQFTQQTGFKLRLSYGSSGNFASQIQHGAPFELLLSADEIYPNKLVEAGFTQDAGEVYAIGRLALAVPKQSMLQIDSQLEGLQQLIDDNKLQRFAIANPAHAPYGERAKQALQAKGLWQAIEKNIILGENASQAAQFAVSGSTQGGIVPLSIAMSGNFARMGNYVVIADELYNPINHRMVLVSNASAVAQQFYAFILSAPAQQILRQYGFDVPTTTLGHLNHPATAVGL